MLQTKGRYGRALVQFALILFLLLWALSKNHPGQSYPLFVVSNIIYGFVFILILFSTIPECMTIQMDSDGCMVRFLCFHKKHAWNSLYVRYRYYAKHSSYYHHYHDEEIVAFSSRYFTSHQMKPTAQTFLTLHTPFTLNSFYVELSPRHFPENKGDPPTPKNRSNISLKESECFYPVDRELFKQKMREWGVKIEGLDLEQREDG